MPRQANDEVREQQQRTKELIERAILDIASETDGEFTADDVRARLGNEVLNDPGFRSEMMGGAFSALAQRGRIKSLGSRTSQAPGMKNRRVTVYGIAQAQEPSQASVVQAVQNGGEAAAVNATDLVNTLMAHTQRIGYICTAAEIANFFLCLQAKPFVILSGISGTGKSLLPRIFADALSSHLISIPVKPNWNDNSFLMGYYNLIKDRFALGPVTKAAIQGIDDPDTPVFVRLDEMNLAHVEHYFSDLLSIMENRRKVDDVIMTDCLPLDLPLPDVEGAGEDSQTAFLRELYLPWNVFVVGTVNIDETTHPFSRKVLDRAFAIDSADIDLTAFPTGDAGANLGADDGLRLRGLLLDRPYRLRNVYDQDPVFFQEHAGLLQEFNSVLLAVDLGFAYRVRDEVLLYMWAWKRHSLSTVLSEDEAFDYCLLQKVLPRCHGTSETARRAVEQLFFLCAGAKQDDDLDLDTPDQQFPVSTRRYRRSAEKALRMLRQYRDDGFFSFWNS